MSANIKVQLTKPTPLTLEIPSDLAATVSQVQEAIRNKIKDVPSDFQLYFDGGKLFGDDTLASLGVEDGAVFTDTESTAANAGDVPTIALDQLTISDLSPTNNTERPLTEVLVVLFDISGSMSTSFLPMMSRLEASKVCFGAFIDKTIGFEYSHAIGLILFNGNFDEKLTITKDLNCFEATLGNFADVGGSTHLYPAVLEAVKRIKAFKQTLTQKEPVRARIICFTDGGDNSNVAPFGVVNSILPENIVIDSVVIGGSDSDHVNLRALCHATGGISVKIPESPECLSTVFEREPVLALSERSEESLAHGRTHVDLQQFNEFGSLAKHPYVSVEFTEIARAPAPVSASTVSLASLPTSATVAATSGGSGSGAMRRITKEIADCQRNPDSRVSLSINQDNLFDWTITLTGAPGSPYEGGLFLVKAMLPSDYPFKPPKIQFITPIYHCNISGQGSVCLDILKDSWSPALTLMKIAQSLLALMTDPNCEDPLDAWKASLLKTNAAEYHRQAMEFTKKHAM